MIKTAADKPIIAYKTLLIGKVDSVDDPFNYQSYKTLLSEDSKDWSSTFISGLF